MSRTPPPPTVHNPPTSLGEAAAIGRIERALFGGDDHLVELGRYEIDQRLGSGSFGTVYRARDPQLGRLVALKVLEPHDDADHETLLTEARTMAALAHPNVAAVYDAGVVAHRGRSRVFIAMELIAGETLRDWLATPRSLAAALDTLIQVGHGVAAAHAAHIVHRDLKPDNIIVGSDHRVRVVDFGLARTIDQRTASERIAGTPAYMAPELLDGGAADGLTDQYAFAVTAWETLTGRRPFGGEQVSELRAAIARGPGKPPRHIPRRIGRALIRSLASARGERFPSMDELLRELEHTRPRWLVPAALVATAATGIAIGAIASGSSSAADDSCPLAVSELTGVWDAARRHTLTAGLTEAAPALADEIATRVVARLDQLFDQWLAAHRDACLASAVRGDQSSALLDRRMSCLRQWRRDASALVDRLTTARPDDALNASRMIGDLPSIAACSDRDALGDGPPLPSDPAQRARIEVLLDELARARNLRNGGEAAIARIASDPLANAHPPLAIAIALARSELATTGGRHDDARAAARDALDRAVSIADRRSIARAATLLVALGAYDTRRKDESLQWGRTGAAAIARLDDRELAARLALAEGNVYMASADAAAAAAAFTRAVASFRAADQRGPIAGTALALLSTAKLGTGKLADGERDLREAQAVLEQALGADHPDLANVWQRVAYVEAARGKFRDALASDARAIAILMRSYGPDHLGLLYPHGARGQHAAMIGDRALADRELMEAARIGGVGLPADHPMLAQIALVRAELMIGDGKVAAACPLAHAARDIVAKTADDRDLGLAYADAIVARCEAASGQLPAARDRARAAAARCDALAHGMPAGPCAIVYQQLGVIARDEDALAGAERAIVGGTPDPARLAAVRLARVELRAVSDREGARELARRARDELPRDAEDNVRKALARWADGP